MRIVLVANSTSGRGRHGGAAHATVTALVTAGYDVTVACGSTYEESRVSATAPSTATAVLMPLLRSAGTAPSTSVWTRWPPRAYR
ncbi:hypothetical protein HMPREF9062_1638 [Actinomyces sp. oral taxon 448 str. F0400]|jgi:hypothetical protein|nr:hypothetical protein HMPREF9062_1638 [Actinomyces sp. oral taxon 448 str. F0400]